MNRKIFSIVLIVVVAGLTLAACMNNDAENTQPQTTADYAPQATAGANGATGGTEGGAAGGNNGSNTLGAGNGLGNNGSAGSNAQGSTASSADGALTPFDWANRVSEIEGAIARSSARHREVGAEPPKPVGGPYQHSSPATKPAARPDAS